MHLRGRWRWTGRLAATTLCALLGCSGGDGAPASSDQPAAGSAERPAPSAAATGAPTTAAPNALEAPDAAAPKSSPTPADRAAAAFATLTTSGVEEAAWDGAFQELVALGADAAPVLARGLQSSEPLHRELSASIFALNWEAAARAVPELSACLAAAEADGSLTLAANVAAALSLTPGEEARALPTLIRLARAPDPSLRRMAAVNLLNVGAAAGEHVDDLAGLLDESDPEICLPAASLLGQLGPRAATALPRLRALAESATSAEVRQAAAMAMERIAAPSADNAAP